MTWTVGASVTKYLSCVDKECDILDHCPIGSHSETSLAHQHGCQGSQSPCLCPYLSNLTFNSVHVPEAVVEASPCEPSGTHVAGSQPLGSSTQLLINNCGPGAQPCQKMSPFLEPMAL